MKNNGNLTNAEREKFGSRLGFILISAGCAIGLGNVWRFPHVVGKYGGAAFILLYLLFLVIFGLPIMTMEFAVGRASKKSLAHSFTALQPKGTKWHLFGNVGIIGSYVLMMFYTTVTAWMIIYFFKMLNGDFMDKTPTQVYAQYGEMTGNALLVIGIMVLVTLVGFFICSLGLKKGVEKVNKVMMIALLLIIVVLAVFVCTLDGAGEGLSYYLIPNFSKMFTENKFSEVAFAALGQAFFTLSIGMGSMAIFGSYISKERSLFGESMTIAGLDTMVAFIAGLIVIPASFAFPVDGAPEAGPGLIFQTLPNIFNKLPGGEIWGACFFLFMIFAAMSTVTAVFENIVAFGIDKWGLSRRKSCLINAGLLIVLALPCILGFSVFSGFTPLGEGTNIMDLEDFIISNNILPLGCLVYVLFCTWERKGWGWNQFLTEANLGKGLKVSSKLKWYFKYVLPILLIVFWVLGLIVYFI